MIIVVLETLSKTEVDVFDNTDCLAAESIEDVRDVEDYFASFSINCCCSLERTCLPVVDEESEVISGSRT